MLTSEHAWTAIEAAVKKAQELNIKISVALFDNHGNLIAFTRMDGAIAASIGLSQAKAYTSAVIGFKTADLGQGTQEGKPYAGLLSVEGGRFTAIAGGLPISHNDQVIGGIGVGGSYDVTQDVQVAEAGLAALV